MIATLSPIKRNVFIHVFFSTNRGVFRNKVGEGGQIQDVLEGKEGKKSPGYKNSWKFSLFFPLHIIVSSRLSKSKSK